MSVLEMLVAALQAYVARAARDGFTLEAVESFLGSGIVAPPELATSVPPAPANPNLAWFASLHGKDLITACYTTLLGRAPDAAGMDHFMGLLAQGADKALIVGSVAYSPEGRARRVRVAGLLPRFAVAAAGRVPVAGALLEWLLAVVTMRSRARHTRALEHYMHLRLDAIGRYVGQSNSQIAMRIESLRSVMEARD